MNKKLRSEKEPEKLYAPCTTKLRTYDSNDLNEKSRLSYDEGVFCNERWHIDKNNALLVKMQKYLLFILEPLSAFPYPWTEKYSRLVIFDLNTLKPSVILSYDNKNEYNIILSKYFNKLKIINALPYTGKAFTEADYQTITKSHSAVVNLKTYEIEGDKRWSNTSELISDLISVENKRSVIHIFPSNGYVTYGNRLIDIDHQKEFAVHVSPDGEAVLHEIRENVFSFTKHAKEHLKY